MKILIANKALMGSSSLPIKVIADRLYEFCQKYDSDADPHVYVERVIRSYYEQNPGTLIFLGLLDDGTIGAHCVIHAEDYYGGKYFFISQFENTSHAPIPKETYEEFWSFVKQWGEANGISKLRVTARNKTVARLLRKYGMKEGDRTYMELPL